MIKPWLFEIAVHLDLEMVADHATLRRQSMRLQQVPLPSFLFSFE